MIPPVSLYEYRALIVSVFDADTLRADIDAGFGIWKRNEPLRLLGLDAPEVRGEERGLGLIARDALRERVLGKLVWLRTVKPTVENFPSQDMRDKYGRYLATIWDDMGNINEWLVVSEYATRVSA